MKARSCPFCFTEPASMATSPELDWNSIRSRALSALEDVKLCAGLGAIVEPYIIAFPIDHRVAITELEKDTRRNLLDALDLCLESGLFPSRSLSVFEHGGRSPDNDTACLEHCHLHVVDGQYRMDGKLAAEFPTVEVVEVSESSAFAADGGYLFAGTYAGSRAIAGALVRAPSCGSQFFRKVLAGLVGSSSWNWRLSPTPDAAYRLRGRWQSRYPETLLKPARTA